MKQLIIKKEEIKQNNQKIIDFLKENYLNEINNIAYVINNGIEKNIWEIIEHGDIKLINNDELSNDLINKSIGLKLIKILEKEKNINLIEFNFDENEFILDFEIKNNLLKEEVDKLTKKMNKIVLDENDKFEGVISNKINLLEITTISGLKRENNSNRIKGFGAIDKLDLKNKKNELNERKKRDHRKIGKELEIFMIDELAGKGLPIWLSNGVILKRLIRDFIIEQENKFNYKPVETPILGSLEFYKKSGHYSHYKNSMFPVMNIEKGEDFMLRPMACPHHAIIFNSKPRSYKELPLKLAEQVKQFRYEASGALIGLERVRAMELTDSHIFLRNDQIEEVLEETLELIQSTLDKFEIKISYLELALHDPQNTEKYHGDKAVWKKAEDTLKKFLKNKQIKFIEKEGEAAFYGPKIDIQIETALKHIITVSTLQLDFFIPEKFDLNYINKNNELERVIMIHRGLIGTYERFISVLLEQTMGVFPLWLAPRQVVIIPVNNKIHLEYANKINQILKENKVRSEIDLDEERLSYKIRKHQKNKINIQIIIGDEELNNNKITYRLYGEENSKTVSIEEFIKLF